MNKRLVYRFNALSISLVLMLSSFCISVSAKDAKNSTEVIKIDKNIKTEQSFTIPDDGEYIFEINYKPIDGNGNSIEINYEISQNDKVNSSGKAELPRMWENATEIMTNAAGNQYAPPQVEHFEWTEYDLIDTDSNVSSPTVFNLKEGNCKVKITGINEEPFILKGINVKKYEKTSAYSEYLKNTSSKNYNCKKIIIEGENAKLKTSDSLVPKADNSDASLSPSSPSKDVINYIGGNSWSGVRESLLWDVDIPEDGYYKVGMRFRQSYNLNGNSFRELKIDGKTPFSELSEIAFPYNVGWQYKTLSNGNGGKYKVWFSKGKHTLSLTVTLGPLADISKELEKTVLTLGNVYKQMVTVMGTTPDANRDYRFFEQCKDSQKLLENSVASLNDMADRISKITGKRGDSISVVLLNTAEVVQRVIDNPYRTQRFKDDFYNNYCSLSSVMYEMQSMPLDLDAIELLAVESDEGNSMAGFWTQLGFSIKRFVSSFTSDYSTVSAENDDANESITLWLYWGRDQTQVINNIIEEMFTPSTGISVNVKIANASLIQAMLSGNGPDCSLRSARTAPVDLAMRGALYPISEFEDFDGVMSRFQKDADLPYRFNGKTYAIPDTQTFYMMFYRKDILGEYGISVPKTWDEFFNAATLLSYNNLMVGIPYVKISTLDIPNAGIGALSLFPTLLLQNGGKVYADDLKSTNLSDGLSANVFSYFTELYTDRDYPVSFDFYNRFRTGEMPIGIASYSQYNSLAVAAKEISGLWGMAPIPGTKVNGVINNTSAGGGTGSVILNQSRHKRAAWEFLKWWTSADVQYRYSTDIESILGAAERQTTANIEALTRLSWAEDDRVALLKQWENVTEIPEVPGSYYTVRSLDQAFWSVYNNGQNPRSALLKWSSEADAEIKRKRTEYGLN